MRKITTILLCGIILLLFSAKSFGQMVERDTVVTGRLEFVVNTNRIIDNECYSLFTNEILPMLRHNEDRVIKVMIVGSASPEGKPERNRYLSKIRAEKVFDILSEFISKEKIDVVSDSELFLQVSRCKKEDFMVRRGVYVEAWIEGISTHTVDTLKLERVDTLYIHDTLYVHDTVYIEKPFKRIPILAVKTNLAADIVATPNVQAELYTWLWGLSLEFDYTCPWWHKD